MSKLISDDYRVLSAHLHDADPTYGTSSGVWVAPIVDLMRRRGLKSVLDFGCGKGRFAAGMAKAAPDIRVLEFDPAIPGKDRLTKNRVDLIVCLDVLEHIEPEYLDRVLAAISGVRHKFAVFDISLTPAAKTLADGRNAHLILESPEWWRTKIGRRHSVLHSEIKENALQLIASPIQAAH